MAGRAQWLESYVTDDKLFCVYIADDEATVRGARHVRRLPVQRGRRRRTMIDPTTAETN